MHVEPTKFLCFLKIFFTLICFTVLFNAVWFLSRNYAQIISISSANLLPPHPQGKVNVDYSLSHLLPVRLPFERPEKEFEAFVNEGDIGFFGFAVLVTFEIGFSVFALKIPGFSVLVSTAVFGFSLFDIRVSVFMNKKAVIRFLRAIRALYQPF